MKKIANKVRFDKVYFNGQDDSLETALKKFTLRWQKDFHLQRNRVSIRPTTYFLSVFHSVNS
ncbi:MAG: hypothetical protein IPF75_00025 [Bacteroidetes bacterium]|nr:hypothetical protein [Bacteroidota bacterium]